MPRKRKYKNDSEKMKAYRLRRACYVAIDGEGYTAYDEHVYASLFAYNGDKLYEIHAEEYGLSTGQILRFIRNVALENKDAIWISFSFSYDVTMFFRELSPEEIRKMLAGGVFLRDYGVYVEYRYRKQLRLVYNKDLRVTIYDLFGFTATSFVNTAKIFGVTEEIEEIQEGKALRGDIERYELDRIRTYTQAELNTLIKIFEKIREYADKTGLALKRYEGAGSVASALFTAYGYTGKKALTMQPKAYQNDNDMVNDRLYRGYYGGRIETLKYGYGQNIFGYDIVSAYPAVTIRLPSLEHAHFCVVQEPKRDFIEALIEKHDYGVITLKYNLPENYFYPFPYRDITSVYYPQVGYSTVYLPVFVTALRNIPDLWDYIAIEDVVYLEYEGEIEYPFKWVEDVFKKRRELKDKGDEAQLILKLGINSLYGKFAQRPIKTENKLIRGTYENIFYAGYITASTQAKLLDAAYKAPDSIIAMATDGIYATREIDCPIGKELGFWEKEVWEEGIFVYSGFYILSGKGKIKSRTRGLHVKNVLQLKQEIIEAWKNGKKETVYEMTIFHSIKRKKKEDDRVGYFEDIKKVIDLTGGKGKRTSIYNAKPHLELCETIPVTYDYFYHNIADLPRLAVFEDETESE